MEIKSTQLKLTKSTVRTLSPAETNNVAGGYNSYYCTDTQGWTCLYYSCSDTVTAYFPHSCIPNCY